jgi:polar amino acid transport system permease protein
VRIIIPPLGNEFNNMLKNISLASVASLFEVINSAKQIGSERFITLDLYIDAAIWFLLMTTIWGFVQANLERRFNPTGKNADAGPSFLSRMIGQLAGGPKTASSTTH